MRLSGCRRLVPRPIHGVWWRAVQVQHQATPLKYGQTATYEGRYTSGTLARPGIAALYLAEDLFVAALEVEAVLGQPLSGQPLHGNPSAVAWSLLPVNVLLEAVVDLTDPRELNKLGATSQDLTGDWRAFAMSRRHIAPKAPYFTNVPTQQLAITLHRLNVEGFITFSSRQATRKNLILFPGNFRRKSAVTCTDPAGAVHTPIP